MKTKMMTAIFTLLAVYSFAQGKKELTDDLVKDKEDVLAKYIPMANGDYLYKLYVMPSAEVLGKLEEFKIAMKLKTEEEANPAVKTLMRKDIDFYARQVLNTYIKDYGMDSIGLMNLEKIVEEKMGTPDFDKLLESAYEKVYVKQMATEERKQLKARVDERADLNDEPLFKRSESYRAWVGDQITNLRNTKYKADTTLGYEGNGIVKLKVIEQELPAGYVKDYLTYIGTSKIITMVRNDAAKEDAYRNFMASVTDPDYKKEIEEVYANYKRMISKSQAPDFTYSSVDGKTVSLKDLRGKYVYIDVWATWCGPCKAEIPFLTKVEEAYHGKNIQFVSLSVDGMKDKEKWISYVNEHKLQGIQVMADQDFNSDFIKKFNINSIPRFILIDPKGNIVDADAKRPSDPKLRQQLDTLLSADRMFK